DVNVQRLGELASDDEPRPKRGTFERPAHGGVEVVAEGGKLGPLRVLLATGSDADHLLRGNVAQALGILQVLELVVRAVGRLAVLAKFDDFADRRWIYAVHDHPGEIRRARGHDFALRYGR